MPLVAPTTAAPAGSPGGQKHQSTAPATSALCTTVAIHNAKVGADRAARVTYFDAKQRDTHRISIRNGVVCDHADAEIRATVSKRQTLSNYVMDAGGHFYLFDEFTTPTIRHSSIFAGGPVAGAGNLEVGDRRIVYIDSGSGHYPSTMVFTSVLKELRERGVDVDAITTKL